MMECDICSRSLGAKRPATCISCTRATLYQPRVDHIQALLGREKSHIHAEAVVRPGNDGVIAALPEDADWDAITRGIQTHSLEKYSLERKQAETRVDRITTKAEELRRQIEECKSYITKRKEINERRRKDLAQERRQLQNRKPGAIEPVQAACKKASRTLDKVHARTAEAREALCEEVAFLNGLGKSKNAVGRTEYRIDGLVIPDLRDLNGINDQHSAETLETSSGTKLVLEQHEPFSASMANICRFLGICCFYLNVRLPAEILLPHNDFAQPMILHERSSYRFPHLLDNAALDASQGTGSATLRRRQDLPRPRLLQIDRPLPKLQQEDPKTYGLFVEGVMWLAWDIAWLCRTQGIDSINTFEDVCAMGKNLHNLFAPKEGGKPHVRPILSRHATGAIANKYDSKDAARAAETTTASPRFGLLSQTSAKNNLAGHVGAQLRDTWRLESSSYNRLFDQLRNYLIDETRKAEWTFIDDREWDEELEHEKPVMVGGSRRPPTSGPAMSVMTVTGHEGRLNESDHDKRDGDERSRKGWTRVRGRPTDG